MKYRLRHCVWEITLGCCFSCKYCGSGVNGQKRENELTTEECINVAEQLKNLGCRRVSLIGGEVFMRKDWDTVVEALTSRGIVTCIITNGFLFREEHINRLKELNIESVAVSLDGPRDVHDKYRQEGSYDRAVRAIEMLTAAGIHVSVITTLNHENAARLEDFFEIVKDFNIFAWQLQACSPMGNAAKAGIDFAFDFAKVIQFVEDHMYSVPFAMGVAHNIGYYTGNDNRVRGVRTGGAPFGGCTAGLTGIGIDSVGNVRGCESMYDDEFIEGNLREKTLAEIWDDPDAFAYNRKFKPELLTGKCSTCEMGKYCAGGCRSYNYFVHGKIYESPACARIKAD
ncbi:MAG: radical SAM protein [Lachnospiraceae bacterium]|nr:radical SAM protein [Lachnospiraceae bacterium]